MVPRLEALEDRTCPDATLIDPQVLAAQMSAALAVDQLAFSAMQALFPQPQPTLLGNVQGLILSAQLEAVVAVQFAGFLQDLGPILLASSLTLGPRG